MQDALTIAGREFGSRLFLGTGKYDTFETMRDAVAASGAEIVTVAVRRIDFRTHPAARPRTKRYGARSSPVPAACPTG
jgi:thiazole synthase ThiGH ThiG subunit